MHVMKTLREKVVAIQRQYDANEKRRKVQFTIAERLQLMIAYNFAMQQRTRLKKPWPHGRERLLHAVLFNAYDYLDLVPGDLASRLRALPYNKVLQMVNASSTGCDAGCSLLNRFLSTVGYDPKWSTRDEFDAWDLLTYTTADGDSDLAIIVAAALFRELFPGDHQRGPTFTHAFGVFFAGYCERLDAIADGLDPKKTKVAVTRNVVEACVKNSAESVESCAASKPPPHPDIAGVPRKILRMHPDDITAGVSMLLVIVGIIVIALIR